MPRSGTATRFQADPQLASSRQERPKSGAEEAKLRSLMKLRAGEIAVLAISSETLKKIRELPSTSPFAPPLGNASPSLSGFYQPEALMPSLLEAARRGTSIDGHLLAEDGKLSWQNSRWKVNGAVLPSSDGPVYQLTMAEGSGECVTTVSSAAGMALLLITADPDPEGLLIVSGKEEDTAATR